MKNTKHVPGSKTLMPTVIKILQENGGTLSCSQVIYMVMFKFDLPKKLFKKSCNEVNFSGVYLRKIGALKSDDKRGVWTLTEDYVNLSFEEAKKSTYQKYNILLGRC